MTFTLDPQHSQGNKNEVGTYLGLPRTNLTWRGLSVELGPGGPHGILAVPLGCSVDRFPSSVRHHTATKREKYCSLKFNHTTVLSSVLLDSKYQFSFQPVLHDWCNKGRGMCYPVCGMMHIKESLLLIGKSSPMRQQRVSSLAI